MEDHNKVVCFNYIVNKNPKANIFQFSLDFYACSHLKYAIALLKYHSLASRGY